MFFLRTMFFFSSSLISPDVSLRLSPINKEKLFPHLIFNGGKKIREKDSAHAKMASGLFAFNFQRSIYKIKRKKKVSKKGSSPVKLLNVINFNPKH